MRQRLTWTIALVLAVTLLAGVSFGATKATTLETLKVKAGTLTGIVADASGKPLPKTTLRLKQDKKIVLTTLTDKAGKYTLKDIAAGKYQLLVGTERALELEVSSAAKVASLQIVVPPVKRYASAMVAESQWIWAAAGTGAAAVAVTVPVLADQNDWFSSSSSSNDDTVSP